MYVTYVFFYYPNVHLKFSPEYRFLATQCEKTIPDARIISIEGRVD